MGTSLGSGSALIERQTPKGTFWKGQKAPSTYGVGAHFLSQLEVIYYDFGFE